jgi:hypothetical protein
MALQGKGFFIWRIRDSEGGDVNAIARTAVQAGLTHVLVKIADGVSSYNVDTATSIDLVPPLVQALHNQGIQVWGWHYVYGYNPIGEADRAVQRVLQTGVDGYVIDAEGEYKESGKSRAAREFMTRLRASLPNFQVALSSYRYPTFHPQLPWREFLEKCDLNMPQVYWLQSHNPGEQLIRSVREFQAITPFRPIVPTGAAFTERNWAPTAEEVVEFLQTAQTLNLTAANFWEWANTRTKLPHIWTAIQNHVWSPGGPTKDIVQQYIDALNTRNPDQVAALYQPNAVHVTAERTVQGVAAIRSWYADLLSDTLPQGVFTLTASSGTGPTRQFTWTARSSAGNVNNGSDTLGLAGGKISYHFSSFSLG